MGRLRDARPMASHGTPSPTGPRAPEVVPAMAQNRDRARHRHRASFPADATFHLLEIGIQAIQLSPYHAGPTAPRLQRLSAAAASMACCCPVHLSDPGKPSDPGTSLRVPPGSAGDTTRRLMAHCQRSATCCASGAPWRAPPNGVGAGPVPADRLPATMTRRTPGRTAGLDNRRPTRSPFRSMGNTPVPAGTDPDRYTCRTLSQRARYHHEIRNTGQIQLGLTRPTDDLIFDLDITESCPEQARPLKAVRESGSYIRANAGRIPDYVERQRAGEAISTAFTESAVSPVISQAHGQETADALDPARRPPDAPSPHPRPQRPARRRLSPLVLRPQPDTGPHDARRVASFTLSRSRVPPCPQPLPAFAIGPGIRRAGRLPLSSGPGTAPGILAARWFSTPSRRRPRRGLWAGEVLRLRGVRRPDSCRREARASSDAACSRQRSTR